MSEPTQGETLLASIMQTEALTTAIMDKRSKKITELQSRVEAEMTRGEEWCREAIALRKERDASAKLCLSLALENQSLRHLLASLEWGSFDDVEGPSCPSCKRPIHDGHGPNCALASAIAGKGAE